jgi:hypothetical protein
MPYFLKGNCVWQGTEEEPVKEVKCHASEAEATAHIRALYANVEDADEKAAWDAEIEKGGPGSGWHRPPEGTHTAENAPNFAGGPGADRTYGTESDEPPKKTRRCKCTKCNAVVILPTGKQCQDIKCPACDGGMRQTEPRKDPQAEGEPGRKPKPGREKAEQETHECTCECGKSVHVPTGQKCSEVKCPECSAMMKQGDSGQDKAAVGTPGPTIHGQGGTLGEVASVVGDTDAECECPHCGKGLPCTAKACPYCKKKIDKVERGEGDKMAEAEKAEWSSAMVNDLPDSSFLYVESGEKDGEGKTTPRSKRHLPYKNAEGKVDLPHLRNAISRLGQPATGKGWMSEDLRKRLLSKARDILKKHGGSSEDKSLTDYIPAIGTVYKSASGQWRWLAISNWAVVDKEREVVSEQAYKDAIAHARETGDYGQLDCVHVEGTDRGHADMLFILKSGDAPPKLGAGGPWDETDIATRTRGAIQADPERWGMSLKFRFDPKKRVHGVYTGGIQILKHSILPREMAASYGTAIAVQGGEMSKQLDEKTVEALAQLGHTEDEIADLAEKQKALPEEENVVTKEEQAAQGNGVLKQLWQQLSKMFGTEPEEVAPDASTPAEARKTEEVDAAPAQEDVEPAQKQDAGDSEEKAEQPDASALLAALAEPIARGIGEMVKAELDKRDERIASLEATVKALNESVEDKVAQRLSDMPPAAKIAPSLVGATALAEAPKGLTFGQKAQDPTDFAKELMAGIKQVVDDTTAGVKFKV